MANANKRKGDAAERKVRDFVTDRYPGSFKTRAGFDDDLGDVIVNHPSGRVVLQVKDVASPTWSKWFTQLREQVTQCARHSLPIPTVGGAIVHKARGVGDAGQWRAIMPLSDLMHLLDDVHARGVSEGRGVAHPAAGLD